MIQEDNAHCDKLPSSLTFAGFLDVQFCEQKLCTVDVIAPFRAPTEEIVLGRWNDVKRLLEKRYGPALGGRVSRPAACARGRLVDCIETKQAEYNLLWDWAEGPRVRLFLEGQAQELALRIHYGSALKKERPVQKGL